MGRKLLRIKLFSKNNDGATIIEAAMVIPVVVMILIGTMQVSLAFYDISMTKYSLSTSVREILLLQDPTNFEITQIVNSNIYNSNNATITVATAFVTKYGSDYTNITANVSYPLVIPFVGNLTIDKQLESSIVINR